jgi:hypothetical protein
MAAFMNTPSFFAVLLFLRRDYPHQGGCESGPAAPVFHDAARKTPKSREKNS